MCIAHRQDGVSVPLRITEVKKGTYRDEEIQGKLEDFKIRTAHVRRQGLVVTADSESLGRNQPPHIVGALFSIICGCRPDNED